MRKLIYLFSIVSIAAFFTSCSDKLDTEPTSQVSGTIIFNDAQSAQTAINGIYRMMFGSTFVSRNYDQAYGQSGAIITQDVMGEDMVLNTANWFTFDYQLIYSKMYNNRSSRPYFYWNYFYTLISNVNYITAEDGKIQGDQELAKEVVAQAYAMRAWCYFNLIQLFQQTYIGNEQNKGVPLYTEPTVAASEGKGRGTVEKTYIQINEDLKRAIDLFTEIGKPVQRHCSHIDYYVANAIKARVALVQNQWKEAYDAAAEALKRPGMDIMSADEITKGMNDKALSSWLWALEIISDQSPRVGFGSFFCHMDKDAAYGSNPRKSISNWLYDQLPNTDVRKQYWWHGKTGGDVAYGQEKFLAKDLASRSGDLVLARGEEMLLIQAEAKCHLNDFIGAADLLKDLAAERQTSSDAMAVYSSKLNSLIKSADLTPNTTTAPVTLLDEVIFQRRVELWGEGFRIFDLLRLKQGYNRKWQGTNHTVLLPNSNIKTDVYPCTDFIMLIPQTEFNGNNALNPSLDQNPTE